jgi:hypothetical protein
LILDIAQRDRQRTPTSHKATRADMLVKSFSAVLFDLDDVAID